MPNIASVLKNEISRLARKEVRAETERLKKAVVQHRSDIAELKRRVAMLERPSAQAAKRGKQEGGPDADPEATARVRFSPKGLSKHRQRLGLSAAEAGILLGVSGPTIYNWEAGKTKPRQAQMAAIANLRKMGKRQAKALLGTRAES